MSSRQPPSHPPDHPLWPILRQTRLALGARGGIRAVWTPSILELADKPMIISGFVTPIDHTSSHRHFLLSRYSPLCPCCPAGGLSEVIEVFARASIAPAPTQIILSGTFGVDTDPRRARCGRSGYCGL